MKMRRMPSHPVLKLEGRSHHFQSFWELELTPGEETANHQHYESEEIIYLVGGHGTVIVAADAHVVQPGEVVLVPPRTDHVIANRSDRLLRAITVESRFDLKGGAEAPAYDPSVAQAEVQVAAEVQKTTRTIEDLMQGLPQDVDEAVAIKTIVELFDIGGKLSEHIETTLGLDNEDGVAALTEVERRIMRAVVEITGRYKNAGRGWLRG